MPAYDTPLPYFRTIGKAVGSSALPTAALYAQAGAGMYPVSLNGPPPVAFAAFIGPGIRALVSFPTSPPIPPPPIP